MWNNGDPNLSVIPVQKAQVLWNEYKYRHDLVWRIILQITTAAVILSVVPYLAPVPVVYYLGQRLLAAPVLATVLVLFSILVVQNELDLLNKIRRAHRRLQNNLFGELHKIPLEGKAPRSEFELYALVYLCVLGGLSLINIYYCAAYWIPPCAESYGAEYGSCT
jgi:hypothetical protein